MTKNHIKYRQLQHEINDFDFEKIDSEFKETKE